MPIERNNYGQVPFGEGRHPLGKLTKVSTLVKGGVVYKDYIGKHVQYGTVLYTKRTANGESVWFYSKPAGVGGK